MRTTRRTLSKKQTQSHHAARQIYREQSELAARLMAEDEDLDLWEPEPQDEDSETLEMLGFDSEIDLADEDDPIPDDLVSGLPPSSLALASLLVVHQGRAIAQSPDWNLGVKTSAWAEERSLRFAMLERLAAWLNEQRAEFLLEPASAINPDPYLNFSLGRTDLNEPIPVLEEGLYEATGCDSIGDFSTFHRHLRWAVLKWPDSHLSLAELLSHRSRIAWVGAAVLDLIGERSINLNLLRGNIAVPKGKNGKAARTILRRIPSANPRKAAPTDYAVATCIKVGVSWERVLDLYGHLIFKP